MKKKAVKDSQSVNTARHDAAITCLYLNAMILRSQTALFKSIIDIDRCLETPISEQESVSLSVTSFGIVIFLDFQSTK